MFRISLILPLPEARVILLRPCGGVLHPGWVLGLRGGAISIEDGGMRDILTPCLTATAILCV